VGLRDEPPPGAVPLLEPVIRGGRRLRRRETVATAGARLEADLALPPPAAVVLVRPRPPAVEVTPALRRLRRRTRRALART